MHFNTIENITGNINSPSARIISTVLLYVLPTSSMEKKIYYVNAY